MARPHKTTIRLPDPHKGQAHILQALAARRGFGHYCVSCCRQYGKTTVGLYTVLKESLEHKLYGWYVMPYLSNCREVFSQKLTPLLKQIPSAVAKTNLTEMSVDFASGGRVVFKGADNPEGLVGATLDYVICDEYAYFPDGIYDKTLSPMLDRRGQFALFISTPFGQNDFYKKFQRGLDGVPGWWSYRGDVKDTGDARLIAQHEAKRYYIPDAIYRTEYLAEFVDGGGAVFPSLAACKVAEWGKPGPYTFFGVDLGMTHDRTVIVGLNDKCELVYFKRFELIEQADSGDVASAIVNATKRYAGAMGFIEKNFNPAVGQMVRKANPYISDWTTTATSKKKLIGTLAMAISVGLLKIPDCDATRVIFNELATYQLKFNEKTGATTYNAPPGGHDDCVMALALAVMRYNNHMQTLDVSHLNLSDD